MKQRRRWEQQWDLSALRAARRSRRAPRRAEERPTPCSSRNTLNFGHRSVALWPPLGSISMLITVRPGPLSLRLWQEPLVLPVCSK